MKIRSVLALLVPLVLLMSCNTQNTAQTVEVGNQPIDGTNLRMISLSSGNRYLDVKQTEVLSALEKTINGGEYNIVSVKTSYTDQYLTSAEITYDSSTVGDGNKLRVILLINDERYVDTKQELIQPKLTEIVNGGTYDIVKVQTTQYAGYLVAAEIYYNEK